MNRFCYENFFIPTKSHKFSSFSDMISTISRSLFEFLNVWVTGLYWFLRNLFDFTSGICYEDCLFSAMALCLASYSNELFLWLLFDIKMESFCD